MEEYKLTSIDYAILIQRGAFNLHNTFLNMTQIQKILFYVYGVCLADGNKLFVDGAPQAWPFGPVFPRVYNRVNTETIAPISDEALIEFRKLPDTMKIVKDAIDNMYNISGTKLSNWTHEAGTPWYETLFGKCVPEDKNQNQYGTIIPEDLIASYFSKQANRNYGRKTA